MSVIQKISRFIWKYSVLVKIRNILLYVQTVVLRFSKYIYLQFLNSNQFEIKYTCIEFVINKISPQGHNVKIKLNLKLEEI